jgi:hypothetical protein|tara:strand:- start:103 stop:537 length:435 start_codon:yes stop_codon:yes gene_type:complete
MSLTGEKRRFLAMLTPTLNELLIKTGNLERISKNPTCDVEKYIRDTILLNKTTFSISRFNTLLQEIHPYSANRLLLHFDKMNLPLDMIYKKAKINLYLLRDDEIFFHKSILDGKVQRFADFLLTDYSSISQSSFPIEETSVSTP